MIVKKLQFDFIPKICIFEKKKGDKNRILVRDFIFYVDH